jgi:hypothetical protein
MLSKQNIERAIIHFEKRDILSLRHQNRPKFSSKKGVAVCLAACFAPTTTTKNEEKKKQKTKSCGGEMDQPPTHEPEKKKKKKEKKEKSSSTKKRKKSESKLKVSGLSSAEAIR